MWTRKTKVGEMVRNVAGILEEQQGGQRPGQRHVRGWSGEEAGRKQMGRWDSG